MHSHSVRSGNVLEWLGPGSLLVCAVFLVTNPLKATAIDWFGITGSPTWSSPDSRVEIAFSGLAVGGTDTRAAGVNSGSISLFSPGQVEGGGITGSLTYTYEDETESGVIQRRIETDFRFLQPGGRFGFSGPAGEWREYDPQFYSGGEKIFTDVLHPSALDFLDFFYDGGTDQGRVIWSVGPVVAAVPDAASSVGLLLASGLLAFAWHLRSFSGGRSGIGG